MKRKVSAILILTVVFQMFGIIMPYAEESSADDINTSVTYNVDQKLLFALNIAEENEYKTNAVINKAITRAEFAKFTAAILGITADKSYTDNRYFKDVPSSYRYAAMINSLVERGIVSGMDEYNFYPDENIEPEHAAIMLLKAAGYTDIEGIGLTYGELIARHRLLSGINGTTLDFGNASKLIVKALKMPKCTLISAAGSYAKYEMYDDVTMLSDNFNVYEVSGVITAYGAFSIYNDFSVGSDRIAIDNEIFDCDIDAFGDLGIHVKAYYKKEKKEDAKKIIFYAPDGKTDCLILKADDIISVDDSITIKYSNENGRTSYKTLPKNAVVLRNGARVTRNLSNAFNIKNGSIRLTSDESGDYRYAFITEYDHVFTGKVDTDIKRINAKYGSYIDYSSGNIERFKVYDENGREASIDDINSDMLLTVSRSESNIEIYICNNIVTGKVESVNDETATIGNTEYDISEDCNDKASLVPGFSGTFYVDRQGKIAYVSDSYRDGYTYGFLKGAAVMDLNSGLKLRVFNTEGEFVTLNTGFRVAVDGNKKDADDAFASLCDETGAFKPQFIGCAVNSDGIVTAIDTAALGVNENKHSLTDIAGGFKSRIYCDVPGSFEGQVLKNANTKIIFVPDSSDGASQRDEDYRVLKSLENQRGYYCAAYAVDSKAFAAEYIVISAQKMDYSFSSQSYIWIVDSVAEVYNSQTGDTNIQIVAGGTFNSYLNGQGGVKTITIADDFELTEANLKEGCVSYKDIDSGDIVEFAFDGEGQVQKIRKLFDYDDKDSWLSPRYLGSYLAYGRYFMCYANSKEGAHVKVGYNSPKDLDEIIYIRADNYCPTIVYDSKRKENRVYEGSWEDVISYEETGDEKCVSVIIPNFFQGGNPHETIIYKYGLENQ